MTRIVSLVAATLAAFCLCFLPARAQNGTASRAWVSGHGADASGCGAPPNPCRTFQYVLNNIVAPSGEIDVLDPAGYGAMTISHAVSIVNDGVGTAGVLAPSGGAGVAISAGSNEAVTLRGLTIDGAGVGVNGIQFASGGALTVQNSVIRHVTGAGVSFAPNAASVLIIADTLVADNGQHGISVQPAGSNAVKFDFNRVQASGNNFAGFGIFGNSNSGTVTGTADNCVSYGNATGYMVSTSGQPTTLSLFNSVASNNGGQGLNAFGAGGVIRLAHSMVTGNFGAGWFIGGGGAIDTYSDNYIDGNGANSGSLTPINRQ